jgi:4-hydroxy-L-threonine phosphate dehydrogenase PdxA
MCDEVVGSEKVVDYRRQFFNVLDNVHNHSGSNQWHYISSGSKAEGLNLPGSDYDVMFINKDINVYERDDVLSNYHDLRTKPHLVLDFDNAMPGFTLLRTTDRYQ